MAFTFDVSTNRGKVRLLVPDTSSSAYVFADAEIDAFLSIEASSVRRAAALALETLASNQALVLKVIKIMDLQTDGAKLSDALLKRADRLREQADFDDMADGDLFDWAEMVVDPFSARERYASQALQV